jgi:hypothetical protein
MHSLEKENGRHLVIRDHTDRGTHESGVAWGETEVAAALALLERPPADVAPVIADEWDRLTDPSTRSGEVLARFSLSPAAVGTADDAQATQPAPPPVRLGPRC